MRLTIIHEHSIRLSVQSAGLSQRVLGFFTRVVNGVALGETVRHIFAAPRLNLDVIDPSIGIRTGQFPVESKTFDLLPRGLVRVCLRISINIYRRP